MFLIIKIIYNYEMFFSFFKNYGLKKFLSNHYLPVCEIDHNNLIIWKNNKFKKIFDINENNQMHSFSFKVKLIGSVNFTEFKSIQYKIIKEKIGKSCFVILHPISLDSVSIWKDLPFAIALCDTNYNILDINETFKSVMKIESGNIKSFTNNFDENKAKKGQEVLWQSAYGVIPMLTWIKNFEDKKLLIFESRLELIKLKNQAQEAQHLQVLGKLASGIIHDFNNLLTAINGFSELLEFNIGSNEILKEIQRNTNQAANLAKELLNFVKEKPAEKKTTDLNEFLNARKFMLQKIMGEKIKVEIISNEKGSIDISETQLEQIVLNMAMNSKDAMLNGGTFLIKVKKMQLKSPTAINKFTLLDQGQYFEIEIADTGEGISKDHIHKIFSPFFSTKIKGTGLGLSSCMRIIQHANGTITLKTSSSGTTFLIYLPISVNNVIKQVQLESENLKTPLNPKRLLLVEDEEVIRNLAAKALQHEGYIIETSDNGLDALEIIKKGEIDGLITDGILPGLDGIILAKKVKEIFPKMKILIVSGYSVEDLTKSLPENVFYLPKPFTLKLLKEKVNSIFL